MNPTRPRVLVILGPTATGKTLLSIELALRHHGEIVSQDSRQVYRYMDIGTAKATPAQRAQAPHHGLDLVLPHETWTVAEHQRLTYSLVESLWSQGRLPVLTGGTGQYLRAIIDGWTIPEVEPHPQLRAQLVEEAGVSGVPALHERLRAVDPDSAGRIMPADLRRIVRALEVWETTGRPLSEQQRASPPPYEFLLLGLTMPRPLLYERIDRRTEAQVREGLLDEIRRLLEMGYDWSLPSMRSIGYGEFQSYFEGTSSLEDCLQRLKYNTHRLVRRQDVWFRRFEGVRWVDPTRPEELHSASEWLGHQLGETQRGAGDRQPDG